MSPLPLKCCAKQRAFVFVARGKQLLSSPRPRDLCVLPRTLIYLYCVRVRINCRPRYSLIEADEADDLGTSGEFDDSSSVGTRMRMEYQAFRRDYEISDRNDGPRLSKHRTRS